MRRRLTGSEEDTAWQCAWMLARVVHGEDVDAASATADRVVGELEQEVLRRRDEQADGLAKEWVADLVHGEHSTREAAVAACWTHRDAIARAVDPAFVERNAAVIARLDAKPRPTPQDTGGAVEPLSVRAFQDVSHRRSDAAFFALDSMPVTFYATALAGEVGELCNVLKKREEGRTVPQADVDAEFGDVLPYLCLLASRCGVDLEAVTVAKFNKVSERKGCDIKLPTAPPGGAVEWRESVEETEPCFECIGVGCSECGGNGTVEAHTTHHEATSSGCYLLVTETAESEELFVRVCPNGPDSLGWTGCSPSVEDAKATAIRIARALAGAPGDARDLARATQREAKLLEALRKAHAEAERLQARVTELEGLINTPGTDDWQESVRIEAAHQVERWGSDHDAGKTPLDWFWLIGYLAQKAAFSAIAEDTAKAQHHTVSTAAALLNWHRQISGAPTGMRPGIEPPTGAPQPQGEPETFDIEDMTLDQFVAWARTLPDPSPRSLMEWSLEVGTCAEHYNPSGVEEHEFFVDIVEPLEPKAEGNG